MRWLALLSSLIANNKNLLQAHVGGAILGQSATQLYTYEVFLWRAPIILATNNWRLYSLPADQREWIEASCVAIFVAEPAFEPRRRHAPELAMAAKRPQVTTG